jgi:hypothetical protein
MNNHDIAKIETGYVIFVSGEYLPADETDLQLNREALEVKYPFPPAQA